MKEKRRLFVYITLIAGTIAVVAAAEFAASGEGEHAPNPGLLTENRVKLSICVDAFSGAALSDSTISTSAQALDRIAARGQYQFV